jgi:uncharacterized protein (DUF2147 family)
MKTLLLGAALAAWCALACAQSPSPASSPLGRWHTISDSDGKPRGVVEITEQAGVLEGRIVGTLRPDESLDRVCEVCPGSRKGQKLLGMQILSGLKREADASPPAWSGGEILDPDNGQTYRVRLELEDGGRTLKVRGYIGFALLGRTQRWQRAPQ